MTQEMMTAKMELKALVDQFSNLTDTKDAAGQVELFLPDGVLEFQHGFDGELHSISGREALLEAFTATLKPSKALYHLNGQHTVALNADCTEAEGISYCQATTVQEVDGQDVVTSSSIRYSDLYTKRDGKWYIRRRRSTFLIVDRHELNR